MARCEHPVQTSHESGSESQLNFCTQYILNHWVSDFARSVVPFEPRISSVRMPLANIRRSKRTSPSQMQSSVDQDMHIKHPEQVYREFYSSTVSLIRMIMTSNFERVLTAKGTRSGSGGQHPPSMSRVSRSLTELFAQFELNLAPYLPYMPDKDNVTS
jgi:hypothetical protein